MSIQFARQNQHHSNATNDLVVIDTSFDNDNNKRRVATLKLLLNGIAQMISDYIDNSSVFIISKNGKIIGHNKNADLLDINEKIKKIVMSKSAVVVRLDLANNVENTQQYLAVEPIIINNYFAGTIAVILKNQPTENQLGYIAFSSALLHRFVVNNG